MLKTKEIEMIEALSSIDSTIISLSMYLILKIGNSNGNKLDLKIELKITL